MHTVIFSLSFSFLYTALVGAFHAPRGFEATLCVAVLLAWFLREMSLRGIALSLFHRMLSFLSFAIALSFLFVTNTLVLSLALLCVVFVLCWMLVSLACGRLVREEPEDLLVSFIQAGAEYVQDILSFAAVRRCLKKIDPVIVRGLLLSLIPLFVFNVLFSLINYEYAMLLREWTVILLSKETWKKILFFLCQSHLLYCALHIKIDRQRWENNKRIQEISYLIVSCIPFFALFSFFQGQKLFWNQKELPFRDVSLYVQHGFWELIAVSLGGYLLWVLVYKSGKDISRRVTHQGLLVVFALELLLIALFSLHKIGYLQWFFGLKDSRIFASCAVLSVCAVFFLCVLHLRCQVEKVWILRVPFLLLLSATVVAAYGNIDRIVTRSFPIRYSVDGTYHKDYSYLLTNSYDNYQDWDDLMLEALENGMLVPKDYYWGNYRPLCEPQRVSTIASYRSSGNTISVALVNHLREHHQYLRDINQRRTQNSKGMLRFNLREQNAYRWLMANKTLVEDFYVLVEKHCG